MINIEEKIKLLLKKGVSKGFFPGASAGIYIQKGKYKGKYITNYGNSRIFPTKSKSSTSTIYDIASLTKPIATSLSIASLFSSGKISLSDNLGCYFPEETNQENKDITLLHLLDHSSGLPSHRSFYQNLEKLPRSARAEGMLKEILQTPLVNPPGMTAEYSDLGYLLLGFIVERVCGEGLDRYFHRTTTTPLNLAASLFFNPILSPLRKRGFAATEFCPWRGRIMRGEVSDENCWVIGGVAGHAGLFGSVESVLALLSELFDSWLGRKSFLTIRGDVVADFLEYTSPAFRSTWALGFDRPSPQGSSGGRYLSPASVGHLGFTGTSFWMDPEKGVVIVLLTNRVHPSRDNQGIKEFRPLFHDRVMELLGLV